MLEPAAVVEIARRQRMWGNEPARRARRRPTTPRWRLAGRLWNAPSDLADPLWARVSSRSSVKRAFRCHLHAVGIAKQPVANFALHDGTPVPSPCHEPLVQLPAQCFGQSAVDPDKIGQERLEQPCLVVSTAETLSLTCSRMRQRQPCADILQQFLPFYSNACCIADHSHPFLSKLACIQTHNPRIVVRIRLG